MGRFVRVGVVSGGNLQLGEELLGRLGWEENDRVSLQVVKGKLVVERGILAASALKFQEFATLLSKAFDLDVAVCSMDRVIASYPPYLDGKRRIDAPISSELTGLLEERKATSLVLEGSLRIPLVEEDVSLSAYLLQMIFPLLDSSGNTVGAVVVSKTGYGDYEGVKVSPALLGKLESALEVLRTVTESS